MKEGANSTWKSKDEALQTKETTSAKALGDYQASAWLCQQADSAGIQWLFIEYTPI